MKFVFTRVEVNIKQVFEVILNMTKLLEITPKHALNMKFSI